MNITNPTRISESQQHRRLSLRRGSVSAPDPFGRNSNLETSRSIVSRITVVRASPLPNQDRENTAQVDRRASWGTQRPAKDHASHGRSRLSFAFASFTPNSSIIGDVGPARTPSMSSPAGSGPPSPEIPSSSFHVSRSGSDSRLSERISRSNSIFVNNVFNPHMTPEQICEIAVASVKGSLAPQTGMTPSPFIPLPDDIYLPFVDRPSEVSDLLNKNRNFKMMYILSQTFPVGKRDPYNSRTKIISSSSSSTFELHSEPDSPTSVEFKPDPPEIAQSPENWSYTTLDYWLRCITREQADDREWVLKVRACVLKKNEHIWTRLKDALGVPAELEEEYEEDWIFDDFVEEPQSSLHESVTVDATGDNDHDNDSVFLRSEDGDTDDRNHDSGLLNNTIIHEPQSFRDRIGSDVSIEPILPGDDPTTVVSPILNAGAINNLMNSVKSERSFGFGGKEGGMENIGEGLEDEVTPSQEKDLHEIEDLVASSSASVHSVSSFNSWASNEDNRKLAFALAQNQTINGLRITTAVETVQPQVSPHSITLPANGESSSSSPSSVGVENPNLKAPSVLVGHYLTALSSAMDTIAIVDGAVAAGSTPLLIGKNGQKLNKEMLQRPLVLPRRRSSLPTHIVAMAEYGLRPLSETVGNQNAELADRDAITKRLAFNDDGKGKDPHSDESGTYISEYEGKVKSSAQQERGTGGHLFIRSFMDVGLEPTLVANNPALRAGARRNFRPGLQYQTRRKDTAGGGSVGAIGSRRPILNRGDIGWDADGNDYAISLGSGSERSFR